MFLHLVLVMKATCNLEEFIPTTPYDLELLKLRVSSQSTSYSDFVNGLLLTCHPKTLLVTSDFDSNQNFAKVHVLLFFFFIFYFLFLSTSPPKINHFFLFFLKKKIYPQTWLRFIELCFKEQFIYIVFLITSLKLIRFKQLRCT